MKPRGSRPQGRLGNQNFPPRPCVETNPEHAGPCPVTWMWPGPAGEKVHCVHVWGKRTSQRTHSIFRSGRWDFNVSHAGKFLLISRHYAGFGREVCSSKPNSLRPAKCWIHNTVFPKLSITAMEVYFYFYFFKEKSAPAPHTWGLDKAV